MTKYDIRLCTDKGVQIHNKGATCKPSEVPDMLACVVMDYLKGAPYSGTMRARVIAGRRYTEYMLLLKNNAMDVYRHAARFTRAEVQEPPEHPSHVATPTAKKGDT